MAGGEWLTVVDVIVGAQKGKKGKSSGVLRTWKYRQGSYIFGGIFGGIFSGYLKLAVFGCVIGWHPLNRPIFRVSPSTAAMRGDAIDFSLYGGAESLADGRPPKRSSRSRRTVVERPQPGDHLLRRPQNPNDFLWLMTEEPHRSRRMEILKAHPEVRQKPTHAVVDHAHKPSFL